MTAVACGIDWAEGHHDIAIVDQDGAVILAEARMPESRWRRHVAVLREETNSLLPQRNQNADNPLP